MAKKATKRALLSSALALVVCISMLIGTTYAWFTDSVTSANNIIKSGNLDIELEYWDGDSWESVEGKSDVLTNTNFEPGVTEIAYLRLANAGSLALKYQLGINIVSETEGKNADGKTFKLSDYVLFGVVENVNGETGAFANREAAVAAVTSAKKISAGYTKAASMNDGEKLYLALVVYMPETVGNVANHDGTNVPEIALGLNVFATQQIAENDSFGNDYDADAIYTDFIVTNEDELVEALANAKEFAVIGIKGNVTWTTGAGIDSTPFVTNAKNITLLGLTEDATFTATGKGVGAIGIDDGTVTFKNLKIVDESVSYAENSWEYGYLEFRGNTVFENCEIVNAIMMEGDSATFKNCSFNSYDNNQYAVWVSNGVANFEDCVITGARGIKIHEDYGSKVDTVVINNNKFINLTKKPGLAIGTLDADTTVVLTNNVFAGTQAGDQGLYSYETDTVVTDFDFTDKDNIIYKNGATNVDQLKKAANVKNAEIYMAPGVYNTGSISLSEGVTLIGDEGVVIEGTLTSTMNNVTVQNVTIKGSNAQRWAYAKGDVVFENCTFDGTGVYAIHYDGTTGANILYKNCKIVGWVAITGGHNSLTFDGCEIYGNGTYGVIRTYGDATVKNCTFDVKKVNTNDGYQDGLHAVGCTITVENCKNVNGDVTDLFNTSSGGKFVMDGANVDLVINTAEELFAFANDVNVNGNTYAGKNVFLAADIDLENAAWTPIGQTGATEFKGTFDGQNYTIKNLNIDSSAQTGKHYSSGLFGWAESGATIKNVKVDGAKVVGNHNVAVIVGYTYSSKFINCQVNNAKIKGSHANNDACGDKVGLIAGYAGNESRFTNCSASDSTVVAGRDGGQLIGAGYNVSVSGCTAENVTVTAGGDCTGANVNKAIIGRVL